MTGWQTMSAVSVIKLAWGYENSLICSVYVFVLSILSLTFFQAFEPLRHDWLNV